MLSHSADKHARPVLRLSLSHCFAISAPQGDAAGISAIRADAASGLSHADPAGAVCIVLSQTEIDSDHACQRQV